MIVDTDFRAYWRIRSSMQSTHSQTCRRRDCGESGEIERKVKNLLISTGSRPFRVPAKAKGLGKRGRRVKKSREESNQSIIQFQTEIIDRTKNVNGISFIYFPFLCRNLRIRGRNILDVRLYFTSINLTSNNLHLKTSYTYLDSRYCKLNNGLYCIYLRRIVNKY